MTRIKKSLMALGGKIEELDGIFITHDHWDHINAVKMLLKYYDVPIYATKDAALGIARQVPEAWGRLCYITPGESVTFGDLDILPFSTPHDAPGSVGYRFDADGRSFGVLTDIGYVTKDIFDIMRGVDGILLEANHNLDMLKNGPYPYYLRQRISSKRGHLSNEQCGVFAADLEKSGTRLMILGHLSDKNNTCELAMSQVCGALHNPETTVDIAPRYDMGPVYII
jgi:phosphoribosyl 1,2-cyclic phosphodiesterase